VNLFCVREKDAEWCCYIFAESKGRAKTLFADWYPECAGVEYTDIRVSTIMKDVGGNEEVCDDDCQRLKDCGIEYDQVEY
jgi:hypothetical protein